MPNPTHTVIAGLGESLFDCFQSPSGASREIMGGAPLNAALIAAYLGQPFGLSSAMISRVGDDDLGHQLRSTLEERGLDLTTLQFDSDASTGRVNVTMIDGEPEYEILENVAWDRMSWDESLQKLLPKLAGITFGTLGQRSLASRQVIQRCLREATQAVRFFDVNLRQDYYSAEVLQQSCELADAIKLNGSELAVVADHLGITDSDKAEELRVRYELRAIILTHGSDGTELITATGRYRAPVPQFKPEPDCDPVGAGDACGAACLIGLCLQWDPQRIVTVANRMGAFVASRRGATPKIDLHTIQTLILS